MSEKLLRFVLQGESVYPIPAAYLQGNLAEMLFWDAVFYLLVVRGETNSYGHRFVETSYAEMQTLADLSRRTLRNKLDAAAQREEPARLWEEEGIRPYSFILKFKQYEKLLTSNKVILKPLSYMKNEWAWVLAQPYPNASKKSRLPLAVMNVLFRKPHGQTASFLEIVNRCRHKRKPPDAAEVEKAIVHLLSLELLTKAEKRSYRLNRERLLADGRQAWQQIQSPEPATDNSNLLEWARRIDPQRANLAEEIAKLGRFDFHTQFKEIFFDLASVQHPLEIEWLRYVVKRKRGYQLSSKRRWQSIWKSYERKLHKEQFGSESKKAHVDLARNVKTMVELSLDNHELDLLRWGKLILWVNDARYQFCGLRRPELVQVSLKRKGILICCHQLCCEDEVVRCDLTKDLRSTHTPLYQLFVEAERPLPQFTIEARLEVAYLPRRQGQSYDR